MNRISESSYCFWLKINNMLLISFEISSNSFPFLGYKDLKSFNFKIRFGDFSFLHLYKWSSQIYLAFNQIHIIDANYYLNLCLEWFRFFLPWVGNLMEICIENKLEIFNGILLLFGASNSTEKITKPYSMEEISSFPKNWERNERFIEHKLIYFVTL